MLGVVNSIPRFKEADDPQRKHRYFAFVKADGKSYFFHVSQYQGDWMEFAKQVEVNGREKGTLVSFDIDDSEPGKLRAKNVRLN